MAALIEIKYDEKKLREIQNTLSSIPRAMPTVMSRAVNRTATMARTEIISRLREKLNLKNKDIREGIVLKKAKYSYWIAELGLSTKRIPILDYAGRQTKKGATYKIQRSGGRELVPSAFEATMGSGHKGIFKRTGLTHLPILELLGPSLGRAFEDADSMVRAVTERAGSLLNKNIDDQVKLLLEKRGVKIG